MSKQKRKNWIIVVAVVLFLASIIYSPHYIARTPSWLEEVSYDFVGFSGKRSFPEFGRLTLTWMGIAVVGAAALYVNHNSKD